MRSRRPDDDSPDLVVLGGGTAGIVGATTAASLGAHVVLVERSQPGGDCLWTGCVPSKALLSAAHTVAQARGATKYGLRLRGDGDDGETAAVNFAAVMSHVRTAIATIAPVDSVESLEAAGVRVLTGTGRFTGPDRLSVAGTTLSFRRALIATGADPALPPVPGLAASQPLTSDSVWSLTELPERLVVLGGGSIGTELGQAFARLGSRVTLVETGRQLLPLEDPAAAELLATALRADGVDLQVGQPVVRVEVDTVVLADGTRIGYDRVLVAVGRTPRTAELGLESAGVQTTTPGMVVVDRGLQTTNPRIWAAGDLTGHPQFTHLAGMHASLAVTNAVLGLHRSTARVLVPRVTFTQPEIAAVGVSSVQAGQQRGLRVVHLPHHHVDRAVAEDDATGYTDLVLDRRGRLVGATIAGPRAGESIGEATLAIQQGLRVSAVAATTHPYPTYNDGLWNAAIHHVRSQLARPLAARAVRALVRIRRGPPPVGSRADDR